MNTFPENNGLILELADRLEKVAPDELIPYPKIQEIILKDPQDGGRYMVDSARRKLIPKGFVFSAVVGVGLKRLRASAIATDVSRDGLQRVRRAARREVRKLETISKPEFDALTSEEKNSYLTGMTMQGLIAAQLDQKRVRKVEQIVASSQKTLQLDETLKLFMTNGKGMSA